MSARQAAASGAASVQSGARKVVPSAALMSCPAVPPRAIRFGLRRSEWEAGILPGNVRRQEKLLQRVVASAAVSQQGVGKTPDRLPNFLGGLKGQKMTSAWDLLALGVGQHGAHLSFDHAGRNDGIAAPTQNEHRIRDTH